ncbi:Predicted membrane protein (DUF2254) [Clostridium paraputrificum]|nr:Predicted membrane protein (DUF2254) [Clostridium paraputrificum]
MPESPWTSAATTPCRTSGRVQPAWTGTPSMPAMVSTARALRVTFSRVWLPPMVVTPTSSIAGLPAARRIATASSWPGSQSRMILRCSFVAGMGAPLRRWSGRAVASSITTAARRVNDFRSPGDASASSAMVSIGPSTTLTVLTTTISMTLIVLQVASGNFSHQLLRDYIQSRAVRGILAVYVGVVAYSITLQRSMDADAGFVPQLP